MEWPGGPQCLLSFLSVCLLLCLWPISLESVYSFHGDWEPRQSRLPKTGWDMSLHPLGAPTPRRHRFQMSPHVVGNEASWDHIPTKGWPQVQEGSRKQGVYWNCIYVGHCGLTTGIDHVGREDVRVGLPQQEWSQPLPCWQRRRSTLPNLVSPWILAPPFSIVQCSLKEQILP